MIIFYFCSLGCFTQQQCQFFCVGGYAHSLAAGFWTSINVSTWANLQKGRGGQNIAAAFPEVENQQQNVNASFKLAKYCQAFA